MAALAQQLVVVGALLVSSIEVTKANDPFLVSYVMEPFDVENVSRDWFVVDSVQILATAGQANTFPTNDTLHGTSALAMAYENLVIQGGAGEGGNAHSYALQHLLSDKGVHICHGAIQVEFSFKHLLHEDVDESTNDFQWKFTLYDSKDCQDDQDCFDPDLLEAWEFGSGLVTADGDWHTVSFHLTDPNWKLASDSGVVGNGFLDVDYIKGWRLDFSSQQTGLKGTILVDQIALNGPGEMLGAAFYSASFEYAISHDIIRAIYFNSDLSFNETHETIDNGNFFINYTVQKKDTWGSFIQYDTSLPSRAYFNLSRAQSMRLNYDVITPASKMNRVHLRLIMIDTSNCWEDCDHFSPNVENYYSFHYVLDQKKQGFFSIELKGDDDPNSPFERTGWFGIVGSNRLDKEKIKGFKLEINIDSSGAIDFVVTGAFQLSDLKALEVHDPSGIDTSHCVVQPGLLLLRTGGTKYNIIEFLNFAQCCDSCSLDETCNFAWSDGRNCYKTDYVDPSDVTIQPETVSTIGSIVFIKKHESNYCDLCECRKSDMTIDCRGKNLVVLPGTFNPESDLPGAPPTWYPKVLDLRKNPRLVILGADSFRNIRSLEEVRLPSDLAHLSKTALKELQALKSLSFDDDNVDAISISNAIVTSTGSYSDICCSRGHTLAVAPTMDSSPVPFVTFCDYEPHEPGIDARYYEYVQYFQANKIETLTPSSSFMSEAAENQKKCAEFCNIVSECRYFTYDQRLPNTEPLCHLLLDQGIPIELKNISDHFADVEKTQPGYISGLVPRTRHDVDQARVIITTNKGITATESSNYVTTYELALGSTPIRGAVWVLPRVVSSANNDMKILISPRKVVFYSNEMTQEVSVSVQGSLGNGGTVVVENLVKSCDQAFSVEQSNLTVFIDVVVPKEEDNSSLWVSVATSAGAFVLLIVFFFVYMERKKKQADSIWHVEASELTFNDPPRVIGSGSFGLVLLAEYRGTEVAVKRVIPPRRRKKRKKGTSSSSSSIRSLKMFDMDDESNSADETSNHDLEMGSSPGLLFRGSVGLFASAARAHQTKQWNKAFEYNKQADYQRLKSHFIEEMRHLSKLRHPCITTVMGAVISSSEEPMLIMEYMDLGSLHDLLRNETLVLEGEQILYILKDIAQGVRFLHAAKPQVIHGDLKGRNILVDSRLRAKVADFGLSEKKRLGATGTPYWMAPELLRGESANTAASDVYAFGITLFEIYARSDPYQGEDFADVLEQVSDKSINKRPPIPDCCPPQVKAMMKQCLDGDPAKRPTFKELDLRLKAYDSFAVEPTKSVIRHSFRRSGAKRNAENLLDEVFPPHISSALREGRKVEPEYKEMVTVLFSDIVGFTDLSAIISPWGVSDLLDRLYQRFDEISRRHDVFKVETIGDSWMGVTNLTKEQPDHADRIAAFAIDALRASNETLIDPTRHDLGCVNLRVGFHSGPVVANVVGSRNPRYCLFGDTVNTAARMESHSLPGRIQCSAAAAERITNRYITDFKITPRGKIAVKGKGQMETFFISQSLSSSLSLSSLGAAASPPSEPAGVKFSSKYETVSSSIASNSCDEQDVAVAVLVSSELASPPRQAAAGIPRRSTTPVVPAVTNQREHPVLNNSELIDL